MNKLYNNRKKELEKIKIKIKELQKRRLFLQNYINIVDYRNANKKPKINKK